MPADVGERDRLDYSRLRSDLRLGAVLTRHVGQDASAAPGPAPPRGLTRHVLKRLRRASEDRLFADPCPPTPDSRPGRHKPFRRRQPARLPSLSRCIPVVQSMRAFPRRPHLLISVALCPPKPRLQMEDGQSRGRQVEWRLRRPSAKTTVLGYPGKCRQIHPMGWPGSALSHSLFVLSVRRRCTISRRHRWSACRC